MFLCNLVFRLTRTQPRAPGTRARHCQENVYNTFKEEDEERETLKFVLPQARDKTKQAGQVEGREDAETANLPGAFWE